MILNIDQKMCQFYTHGKEIIFLFFHQTLLFDVTRYLKVAAIILKISESDQSLS